MTRLSAPFPPIRTGPQGRPFTRKGLRTSWTFPGQVMTNVLTNDAIDPVTDTPEFKACTIAIEAVEPGRVVAPGGRR